MLDDRRIAWWLAVSLGTTVCAAAHPIVIHAGALEWRDEHLRVVLVVDPHSLDDERAATGEAVSPRRFARALADSVHVFSPQADRLAAGRIVVLEDGALAVCDYVVPAEVKALALVHRPGDDLAPLTRQLQLEWSPPGARYPRVIRLTSGGNHAVLQRDARATHGGLGVDPFVEPVFRVAVDSPAPALTVPAVQIDYPCTLLATWPDLLDCDTDAITGLQFRRLRPRIAEWTRESLSVTDSEQHATRVAVERVDLLTPCGEVCPDPGDERYSIYTTRVRMQVKLEPAESVAWTDLTWNGFNAAVLCVPVIVEQDNTATTIGSLTPSQATVRINHTERPGAVIH